jgi:hypothetical protein
VRRPRRCPIGTPPSRAPVTAIEDTVTVEQHWELARRYLGHEGADGYIQATRDVTDRMCAIRIRPEHRLTRDYTKAGG